MIETLRGLKHIQIRRSKSAGLVSVLALFFLAMLTTLSVSFFSSSSMSLAKASNQATVFDARLTSESGLEFMSYHLSQCRVSGTLRGQQMLQALATSLGSRLDGSACLGGGVVTCDGTTITIPAIATLGDRPGSFTAQISLADSDSVLLSVTGSAGQTTRRLGIEFDLSGGRSGVFDYGVASRSPIVLTGNARITGKNSPAEANLLSATELTEAFRLTGNVDLPGDLYTTNPEASVTATGNVKIGGVSYRDDAVADHIHFGEGETEFPEVDPTVFEPFATTIVNKSTSTSGNKTFTNIRIAANTDPTFSGNITIRGVVYVEVPNKVTFSGNLNFTGVIVTQDAGDNNYTTHTLNFTGNTSVQGVESLPDTAEFSQLRQMPGSFLLAPGFGAKFTGNFGTVSGCLAADAFTWTGNAGGTVAGTVINYSDSTFTMTGNSHIIIDRENMPDTPPGFTTPGVFVANAATYTED